MPWVVVAASLWGLMGLRGLQDYWCVDDDLATLCSRVRDRWKNCAILYVSPVAH